MNNYKNTTIVGSLGHHLSVSSSRLQPQEHETYECKLIIRLNIIVKVRWALIDAYEMIAESMKFLTLSLNAMSRALVMNERQSHAVSLGKLMLALSFTSFHWILCTEFPLCIIYWFFNLSWLRDCTFRSFFICAFLCINCHQNSIMEWWFHQQFLTWI